MNGLEYLSKEFVDEVSIAVREISSIYRNTIKYDEVIHSIQDDLQKVMDSLIDEYPLPIDAIVKLGNSSLRMIFNLSSNMAELIATTKEDRYE